MANIVLVQPLANRFDFVSPRIPNGLLAVAAKPEKMGLSVVLIDQKIDRKWQDTLKQSIDRETICVGIHCSTGRMIKHAVKTAEVVRQTDPDLPIIWGGPHPTILPEQTLRHKLVDFVVVNEGDNSFLELVEALRRGRDVAEVAGIGYCVKGEVRLNEPRPLINDLESLPLLPYDLVDISKYSSLNVLNLPSVDLITSRGCPFNCGFCSTPFTSRRKWRSVSVDRMIEEIGSLWNNYGIRTFYFSDDNFMVDLQRVQRFLDALKANSLPIFWGTQGVRIDTINRMSSSFLDRLEDSGCMELSIGVESANPDILEMIDKRITVEDVLRANGKLVGRRFAIKYNMIIGFPGETMESVQNTVQLAIELYKSNPKCWFPFNIYTPLPGTPLFQKAVDHGFKVPDELEGWSNLEPVGWERWYGHWMSDEENERLRSINFTSYLAFPAAAQKIANPFKRFLFSAYRPVAYFRFVNEFYALHIERLLLLLFRESE